MYPPLVVPFLAGSCSLCPGYAGSAVEQVTISPLAGMAAQLPLAMLQIDGTAHHGVSVGKRPSVGGARAKSDRGSGGCAPLKTSPRFYGNTA